MVLAALTLLPALLGFLGPHLDRCAAPRRPSADPGTGFWYRCGHEVARAAWWCLGASLLVLLLLAAPILDMRLGFPTDGNAPTNPPSARPTTS